LHTEKIGLINQNEIESRYDTGFKDILKNFEYCFSYHYEQIIILEIAQDKSDWRKEKW